MKFTAEYLDALNELIPGATAEGAYCAGILSALAWEKDQDPPRALLEIAVTFASIPKAIELWRIYWSLRNSGSNAQSAARQAVETIGRS